MSLGSPERLSFALPAFTRHCWGSTQAEAIWNPRIKRIIRAWLDIEWLSVVHGLRPCALIWVVPEHLSQLIPQWEAAHLSAISVRFESARSSDGQAAPDTSGLTCVAVGELSNLALLRTAWLQGDHHTVGTLLGYPNCCRTFFQEVWVEQQCRDTTWWMASRTRQPQSECVARIELSLSTPPFANILWRWLGVRAVPHLPCRFDCEATISMARLLLQVGRDAGYGEEVEWITEILTWPVEWSALHGIAEVKSPLMKLSTSTDATSRKWSVQWVGTAYPSCGLSGLRFPYRQPGNHRLTVLNASCGDTDQVHSEEAWMHADNGFASNQAMAALHHPLLTLARSAVQEKAGNVLDLGCGNGMLLAKVCGLRAGLTPYGIDSNALAIKHARDGSPQFAGNFVHGNLFDLESWRHESRNYVLAFLMLGRLLEVPRDQAVRLLEHLRACTSHILCYVYPDWANHSLVEIARDFGVELEDGNASMAYVKVRN